jgi:transcription elongation GreA/GreB family factor
VRVRHIDKDALVKTLRDRLAAELEAMVRIAKDAADAATHEENRQEGDKDMRSTEASYIARGHAARAVEREHAVAVLTAFRAPQLTADDPIQAGALVTLVGEQGSVLCLLLPVAGGERLRLGEEEVQVVTPSSPLGQSLLGLFVGEEAAVSVGRGWKRYEVASIA